MAGKDRRPTEMEADLWRRITNDVKPLNRAGAPAPESTAEPAAGKTPPRRPAAPERREAPSIAPELRHGETAGIDRRTADNLRRGKMSIEARLDLHGMTQTEAHRALAAFVAGQHESGRRCVLVVTGKGREGGGVLRGIVPQWLNGAELRPRVLAFNYAQPRDGGDGALYVLLRRQRR
jgi:DNA-nicking Smr family endonuclease